MLKRNFLAPVLAIICALGFAGFAEASEESASEAGNEALAKAVQNPLANLINLPLQFNYNTGVGDNDRTFFNLNVQPVIPFPGEKWNIISRTIIPVNSVPIGEFSSEFGIGDANFSLFWSPAKSSSLTWGVGPAVVIPTASNPELLGSGKLSLGPTAVIFYGVGNWTMGFVTSNVWSVAGDSDRDDVNFFLFQYFANFNFGGGWALGTAPILTADWQASSGNQWTVPFGLQLSKVMRFGPRPVSLLLGYYNNVESPDGGAESQVRFQFNLLFPT